MDSRTAHDGISLAPPQTLIVLKAKAWMDLRERKASGESIDSKDIRKHRNDIARLAAIATPGMMTLPPAITADMADFLQAYAMEPPPLPHWACPCRPTPCCKPAASLWA